MRCAHRLLQPRWGDRELHSYPVGVFEKKHKALICAETEREWRGGKYECEVIESEFVDEVEEVIEIVVVGKLK